MAIELTQPASSGGGGGSGSTDPLVPDDGTQNVTGDLDVSGDASVGGVVFLSDGTSGAPALAFSSNTDTGIIMDGTVPTFVHEGINRFEIVSNGFQSNLANGAAVRNETSSATNPTIIPDRADLTAGLGGTGGSLSLITGGTEAARWNSSQQTLAIDGSIDTPGYSFINNTSYGLSYNGSNAVSVSTDGPSGNVEALRFSFGGQTVVPSGSLAVLYNSSDETTNFERARLRWSNDEFVLETDAGGSGQFRDIIFDKNGSGLAIRDNGRHTIIGSASGAAGFVVFNDNNAFIHQPRISTRVDTPAYRISNNSFSTDYSASSGNQIGLQFDTDINQTGTASYEAFRLDITETSVGSGNNRLITGLVDDSEVFGLTPAGQLFGADGTAGAPTYGFGSDDDSGAFLNGPGDLGWAIAGTAKLLLNTSFFRGNNTGTPSLRVSAGGIEAAPAYGFVDDTNTGAYRIDADEYGITTSGTLRLQVGGSFVKAHKATGSAKITLADAATITTDASRSNVFKVELEGDRTLANPDTGTLQDGFTYMWMIQQDVTGSRTLSYGDKFLFPSGITPTLTTTVSGIDTLTCVYDGDRDVLLCNFQQDYS